MERPRTTPHGVAVAITVATYVAALVAIWAWGVTSARHLAVDLLATYLLSWTLVLLISKAPRRELCTRFLLTLISLMVGWGVLESLSIVGLIDYRMLFGAQHEKLWLIAGNEFDKELLFKRLPNLEIHGEHQGNIARAWCLPTSVRYRHDLEFDEHGFRNDRDLSRADIAVVGDSYIEAVETPHDQIVTTLLSRVTGSVVANLSLSGYGPQQELVVLERYALPLRPRVVVWAFYEGNDLSDVLDYDEQMARSKGRFQERPTLVQRSFAKNALNGLYRFLQVCTAQEQLASHRYGVFRNENGDDIRMYFMDEAAPLAGRQLRALDRVRKILGEAHRLTRDRGIRLVFVFVPSKFRALGDSVDFPHYSECLDWPDTDLPKRLELMVEQLSPEIGFVDLTPVFVDAAAKGRSPYLPDDIHWSPLGHRLAAEVIAGFLSKAEPARTTPSKRSQLASISSKPVRPRSGIR